MAKSQDNQERAADDDEFGLRDDFPLACTTSESVDLLFSVPVESEEVAFSGVQESYCVCFVDMVNSTTIASSLSDVRVSRYYSVFLNAMATIAKNFGAKILKNAGDSLIYYFPKTSNSEDENAFHNVLECNMTMIYGRNPINAIMSLEQLPPLNYRISADYGKLQVAKSLTSNNDDLFGSAMNLCAKINSKAPDNSLVVGTGLYQVVTKFSFFQNVYEFSEIGSYVIGGKEKYPVFLVAAKTEKTILNPFKSFPEQL